MFDLKFILEGIKEICLEKKKIFLLLWVIFLPLVMIVFLQMIITGFIYYTFLWIKFFYYNYLVKKNGKIKKTIKYNYDKIFFKNPYLIIIKILFFEKPKKIAFFSFYNILNFIRNIKSNKKNVDITLIIIILYNITIRLLIIILTSIPLTVFKMNTYFILKIKNSWNFKYTSINNYIKFILINCMYDIASEIEVNIKKLKIIIKKKTIIFNTKDLKNNIWKEISNKIKGFSDFKNAVDKTKMLTFINNVRHQQNYNYNQKKIKETKIYTENYLKENLQHNTSKNHLTIFFKLNNGTIFYINETSKEEMLMWDNDNKKLIKIPLNYYHKGTLDQKKETYYTPLIETKEKDIIINNDINILIDNNPKKEIIKNNMIVNLLLNADEPIYKTKYIHEKEKNLITKEKEWENIIKKLEEEKNNLSNKKLIDYFKITEEFIKKNEDIINQIPKKERINFIQNCLNYKYNENSNLFKEILNFYFFKN